jgi:hypothetical protein
MADEWNEQLQCPNCSKTGIASLSQTKATRRQSFNPCQMALRSFKPSMAPTSSAIVTAQTEADLPRRP